MNNEIEKLEKEFREKLLLKENYIKSMIKSTDSYDTLLEKHSDANGEKKEIYLRYLFQYRWMIWLEEGRFCSSIIVIKVGGLSVSFVK